jgi:signal transduction histidine kinase
MLNSSHLIDNVKKIRRADIDSYCLEPVDLGRILDEVTRNYNATPGRDTMIEYVPVQGHFVLANSLLRDVFSNLINNSIKHSDPDKPLIVDIRVDRIKEKGVDYLRCIVEDNGPGISNWVKDKIFMRFQRGDTKAHGKGLGLHIAKTLVEDYGGKMWVEDRVPGDYARGARFVVVLPAA